MVCINATSIANSAPLPLERRHAGSITSSYCMYMYTCIKFNNIFEVFPMLPSLRDTPTFWKISKKTQFLHFTNPEVSVKADVGGRNNNVIVPERNTPTSSVPRRLEAPLPWGGWVR